MKTLLQRFVPGKKIALAFNAVILLLAIAASFAKGSFNIFLLICFALPVLAIASGSSKLRELSLWASGLLVGCGFLIATIGAYSEITAGQSPVESILIGAGILIFTLPTFFHLYYTPPVPDVAANEQPPV